MSRKARLHRRVRDAAYLLSQARRRPFGFLVRKLVDQGARMARSALVTLGFAPYRCSATPKKPGALGDLLSSRDLEAVLSLAREACQPGLDHLVTRADRILCGEVDLFSRTVRGYRGVDWHRDEFSGHRWPAKFHGRFVFSELLDLENPSDVKVPWELSRLQGLPVLALAYRLDGERRYLDELVRILRDWDRSNPVGIGINWTVGMEVAIRAINLVWTSEILAGSEGSDALVRARLTPLLIEHGRFLFRNLEYSDINGNHFTSCLLGLLYLGLYLPGEREAHRWTTRGVSGLREAMALQVYPDGTCHEGSIPYHRLVTELFLHAAILDRRQDLALGEGYFDRLEAMMEFVAAYTKPTGRAPIWGDTDDGRVLHLGSQDVNDHRYLLTVGAALFERTDLLGAGDTGSLDGLALLDRNEVAFVRSHLAAMPSPEIQSTAFPEGGFFILRRDPASYCLIDCGDVGLRGRGGHGHNDALAVEVVLGGLDVLTDGGTASYTRSVANRSGSISVVSHNVGTVSGIEPAPISFDRLPHATSLPVEVLSWQPDRFRFHGRHRGFPDLPSVEGFERCVELGPEELAVTLRDRFIGRGARHLTWRFHFAEGWTSPNLGTHRLRLVGHGQRSLELRWSAPSDFEASVTEETYHPSYDNPRRRQVLTLSLEASLPAMAVFYLRLTDEDHRRGDGE